MTSRSPAKLLPPFFPGYLVLGVLLVSIFIFSYEEESSDHEQEPSDYGQEAECLIPSEEQTPPHEAYSPRQHRYFELQAVEAFSGRPIPGVKLTTTAMNQLTTDRYGRAAFYEPDLMGERVFFTVAKPGFSHPEWAFGIAGKSVLVFEGGSAVFRMLRTPPTLDEDPLDYDTIHTRSIAQGVPSRSQRLEIFVTDSKSGQPIPAVSIEIDGRKHWTDTTGRVAYFHIDHMNQCREVLLSGQGFLPKTVRLETIPGRKISLELDSLNLATRLYRITGEGRNREAALLGIEEAEFNSGKVIGQDSVHAVPYKGKIFWVWGDTNRSDYPLGNFRGSAATSGAPYEEGEDPNEGIQLDYFVDDQGFAKQMAPDPAAPLPGPIWLCRILTIEDSSKEEHLFVSFVRVPMAERGLMKFNDEEEIFERHYVFDDETPSLPVSGCYHHLSHKGTSYVYSGGDIRFVESVDNLTDPSAYEFYSPFIDGDVSRVERDEKGQIVYRWRRDSEIVSKTMVLEGTFPAEDYFGIYNAYVGGNLISSWHSRDPDTGKSVLASFGRMHWNPYRQRFVSIASQFFSANGPVSDVVYAEADTPMGPWLYARPVVIHQKYSFYNPQYDYFFDQDGGRTIFFEGTLTKRYTRATPIPRHDYNQILYRMDLSDSELALPVPVYEVTGEGRERASRHLTKTKLWQEQESLDRDGNPPLPVAFFAKDRAGKETIPVYEVSFGWFLHFHVLRASQGRHRVVSPWADFLYRFLQMRGEVAFHALPLETHAPPSTTAILYEYSHKRNPFKKKYTLDPAWSDPSFSADPRPLFRVWKNPFKVRYAVMDYLADPDSKECCR